jgi:hypothetical protein
MFVLNQFLLDSFIHVCTASAGIHWDEDFRSFPFSNKYSYDFVMYVGHFEYVRIGSIRIVFVYLLF